MMGVWPIMAYMGAQGFTASVSLGGLLAIPFLKFQPVRLYALGCSAFLIWVCVLSFALPGSEPVFEGHMLSGDFSVNAPGLRFAALILAAMSVLIASAHIPQSAGRHSLTFIRLCALVQGLGVLVTAFCLAPILSLISQTGQSDPNSMMQNLLRNANAFALILPVLLIWIWRCRTGLYRRGLTALLIAITALAFWLTGTQSGLISLMLLMACLLLSHWFPRQAIKYMFTGLAGLVLTAPLLIPSLAHLCIRYGLPLPASFFSRAMGWQLTGEKIHQAPYFGHGIEATYAWRTLYAERPAWLAEAESRFGDQMGWAQYEILNSHPHNMPLQIWVDTGLIGAVLAALSLILLGRRLQSIVADKPLSGHAIAAFTAVCTVICNVSYNMWNEAFWASVTLIAAVLILDARTAPRNSP